MRYFFRGVVRATGKQVEGHADGPDPDAAYHTLSNSGITVTHLRADPAPPPPAAAPPAAPAKGQSPAPAEPANPDLFKALDSALDASSNQIPFDQLTEQFKGKSVWVIDREKIRRRVAQVVDETLAEAFKSEEGNAEIRRKVADAVQNLLGQQHNMASRRSIGSRGETNDALEDQIDRLTTVVARAESVLGAIALAANRMGRGGGGGRRNISVMIDDTQNEVLAEIFRANLDLRKKIESGGNGGAGPLTEAGPEAPV